MSNLEEGLNEQAPVEGAPTEAEAGLADNEDTGGQASPPEPPAEPEYEYVDPESLAGKYVRLKVDGEELSVPWEEATSLAQQGKDYTQKTQRLAERERDAESALRLAQAIQSNPGLTMRVLADQAGMGLEEFLNLTPGQQQQAAAQASEEAPPTFDDPLEQQLWEERQARKQLEQRIDQQQEYFERQQADQVLRQAVSGLQQQHGASEEDVHAVVGQALQMGVGPEMFPMIYQSMQYQKQMAQQQAAQQYTQSQQESDQQRQAAAAAATRLMGTGAGASTQGQQALAPDEPASLRDAIEKAYDQAVGVDA